MREKKPSKSVQTDVIERYCPKRGENVIMLRTYGKSPRLRCVSYDTCEMEKDSFCGSGASKRAAKEA